MYLLPNASENVMSFTKAASGHNHFGRWMSVNGSPRVISILTKATRLVTVAADLVLLSP